MQRTKLVGVTGHQFIPETVLQFVVDGVRSALEPLGQHFRGVSSLAAGADQVFASIVLELGGSLKAVIPCERYEDAFTDPTARREYFRLLAQASERETLPYADPSDEAFLAAGIRVVELSEIIIAAWDGKPAKGKGGTADVVAYARDINKRVVIVWPEGLER